jgi:hypothetical protein
MSIPFSFVAAAETALQLPAESHEVSYDFLIRSCVLSCLAHTLDLPESPACYFRSSPRLLQRKLNADGA